MPPASNAALDPAGPVPDASAPTARAAGIGELYRQLWEHSRGVRPWLTLACLMLVASQLVKLAVPWLVAQAVDTAAGSRHGADLADCLPWIGAIVSASIVCWSLHGPARVIERRVALRVRRSLNDRLYARMGQAPLAWFERENAAGLAHRVGQSTAALSTFAQNQFVYLQSAVNLIGPLVALALLSGLTCALAIAGVCAICATIVAFDGALLRLAQRENHAERGYAAALMDSLSNVSTVMSLRLQDAMRRLLWRRLEAVAQPLHKSIPLNEWKWCAVDLLSLLLSWALVIVYAWQSSASGLFVLSGVFMVHQYAQQANGVIGSLAANLQGLAKVRSDFAAASPLFAAPQRSERTPDAVEQAWRHVDLCDLALARARESGSSGPVRGNIRHVTLRLHAGERIALVGASGSGKSTLLRLLAGLYEPTSGHLAFDGVVPLDCRDLRASATLIPQECQIFEGTVRENLTFDAEVPDEHLAAVARLSALDEVLEHLPLGLDAPLSSAGSNLSGGQRQRLGLARGLLASRCSAVVLLDEPTSALDPLTEADVYRRIFASRPDACIVASVHRMHLLEQFDRVVLMHEGRIVDAGTCGELAGRQPMFRRLRDAEVAAPSHEVAGA